MSCKVKLEPRVWFCYYAAGGLRRNNCGPSVLLAWYFRQIIWMWIAVAGLRLSPLLMETEGETPWVETGNAWIFCWAPQELKWQVVYISCCPWVARIRVCEGREGGARGSPALPPPLYTPPAQHLARWIAIPVFTREELFPSKGNYREVSSKCNMGFWIGA